MLILVFTSLGCLVFFVLGFLADCVWQTFILEDILKFFSGLLGVASILFAFGGMFTIATKDFYYEEAVYERQVLEYRIKYETGTGNEFLFADLNKFNNDLRSHKAYSDSPWIGLFYNDKIATLEYIELN